MPRNEERKTDVAVSQVFKYGIHFHRLTGIWPEDDRLMTGLCKVKGYFFVANVIGIVVYQLTAFIDEDIDMSEFAIEAIASFAAVAKVVPVLLSRETVVKLIHMTIKIQSFPKTTAKESRVIDQWQKIQDKLIKICICSYSAVMITFLITPMLNPNGIPFQGVTTKSTFEPPWYQIIYALHVAMAICRLIGVLSSDTLSITFMCQLCSELESVELSMRSLKCISKIDFLRKIERHINVMYYGGLICKTFSVIFLLQHLIIAVLLTFAGIVILYTDSSFIASKMALIVSIAIVSMLIICYVGEMVNSASLDIANTIQCNAYEAFLGDHELLKLVNFVLFRAQKPLSMAVGNNGTINLRFFCQTMSNVFSFFMLLKTVMD